MTTNIRFRMASLLIFFCLAAIPFNLHAQSTTGVTESFTASSTDADSAAYNEADSSPYATGRILVKYRPEANEQEEADVRERHGLGEIRQLPDQRIHLMSAEDGAELATIQALNAEPMVEYAELDYVYHAMGTLQAVALEPDDAYLSEQWGVWQIDAQDAWETTTGSTDIVIAIVDTGIDLTHPDLADKLVSSVSFVDGSPSAADDHGHGTHVASTAAGASNNAIGVAGVSWGAQLMPVKVLDRSGSGYISDIAEGIRWAVDNGADVINLSLGGTEGSYTLEYAVDYAVEKGVVVVAAMGNEYLDGNPIEYPAAYDGVIAVAASDQNDDHASFSNSGIHVDVTAPGVDILAATWRGNGGSYAIYDGTSMAASFVSGLASLLLSIDPDLENDQLLNTIADSATDVELIGWDSYTGSGRINAAGLVAGRRTDCLIRRELAEPLRAGPHQPPPLGDIWTISTRSGEATQLTATEALERPPVWSLDGRYLAFVTADGQIGMVATATPGMIWQIDDPSLQAQFIEIAFAPSEMGK